LGTSLDEDDRDGPGDAASVTATNGGGEGTNEIGREKRLSVTMSEVKEFFFHLK